MIVRWTRPTTHDHVRIVFALFLWATVGSFLYCLVLGQFNGDFFPLPVYLSSTALLVVLASCLLPYLSAWNLSAFLERFPPRHRFIPSQRALLAFLILGFGAHILATLIFRVGVLDAEVYSAPAIVRPFIQILNRLDPFYLGAFFILATPKKWQTDILAISLMLATSLLRAGLGAFAYVFIAISIKYRRQLLAMMRRYPWLVSISCLGIPYLISVLYAIRGSLRGDATFDYSLSDLLFGRLIGRLSAFSNVAYIHQDSQSFMYNARMLDPLYYVKQSATSLLGSSVSPSITPEQLLISGNTAYFGYSTFMTGVPGNLMMSWYVSPAIFVLNLVLIIAMVFAVLWCSRYLGGGVARTFGLGMLFYPLTSGVASEFSSLVLNTLLFVCFAVIFGRATASTEVAYE